MSVDIDPATGAPIVKDTPNADFTPSTDAPTTEGNKTQAPQTNEAQTTQAGQGAQETMEVKETLPPPEIPKHLLSKQALRDAIKEVARRHCSDTVSVEKCTDEVAALFPDW